MQETRNQSYGVYLSSQLYFARYMYSIVVIEQRFSEGFQLITYMGQETSKNKILTPHKNLSPFPQPIHGPLRLSSIHIINILSGCITPYLFVFHIGYLHLVLGLPGIWHYLSNYSYWTFFIHMVLLSQSLLYMSSLVYQWN